MANLRSRVARLLRTRTDRFVADHWDRQPFRGLANAADRYVRIWSNRSNNLDVNGEREVIARLAPDLSVVVDVGANVGDWTATVRSVAPATVVHSFEPEPKNVEVLHRRFADGSVHINPVGLSDRSGTGELIIDPVHHSMNSFTVRPELGDDVERISVATTTGDLWAEAANVNEIDLLKIDTEGHDLSVLQGFTSMLAAGQITVIQFEYNAFAIYSRTYLRDFYLLLEPLGYRLGKLRPNGVEFHEYDTERENWIGPDYVAVHASRPDLVERLACRR